MRLDPLEVSAPKEDFSQSLSLDSSTLLFTHVPAIFFVLHLIYEELKLNCLMGEGLRSLVVLLVQLARYADKLQIYIVRSLLMMGTCYFYGEFGDCTKRRKLMNVQNLIERRDLLQQILYGSYDSPTSV